MVFPAGPAFRGAAVAVVLIAALGGCGTSPEANRVGEPENTEGDGPNAAQTLELTTADTDLGTIVVDPEGRTVYVFDNDSPGAASTCDEACIEQWPPVTTSDNPAGDGIEADLGTATRTDGSDQATINGLPLYYFAEDEGAGDVNGQGVGGRWWVVGPDGDKITDAAETNAPSSY